MHEVCKQNMVWLLGMRRRARAPNPDSDAEDLEWQKKLLAELPLQDALRSRRYQDQLEALS